MSITGESATFRMRQPNKDWGIIPGLYSFARSILSGEFYHNEYNMKIIKMIYSVMVIIIEIIDR